MKCSKASGRNANKVVLYEDAAKKQLQEFISALRGCELMAQTSCSLGVILENVESQQLHYLLTPGIIFFLCLYYNFNRPSLASYICCGICMHLINCFKNLASPLSFFCR